MNRYSYEGTDEGRHGGSPEWALAEYLLANRISEGVVTMSARDFRQFAASLGNMRGTVYPFQDGGIRYAGPTGWIVAKPEPVE